MSKEIKKPSADERAADYWQRVRKQGAAHKEFHWLSMELLLNLSYTDEIVRAELSLSLNEDNLSLTAFNVLMILYRSENFACPLYQLGELLLVSRANITGLVDCLEKRGLVERAAVAGDRRMKLARLTKAGEKLSLSLLPAHYRAVRQLCASLNDKEKTTLNRLLKKMRAGIAAFNLSAAANGDRKS